MQLNGPLNGPLIGSCFLFLTNSGQVGWKNSFPEEEFQRKNSFPEAEVFFYASGGQADWRYSCSEASTTIELHKPEVVLTPHLTSGLCNSAAEVM